MFIKIENNIVSQKQPNEEDGFVEVHGSIVCGMIHDGSSGYAKTTFSNPEPTPKTADEIKIDSLKTTESVSIMARKLEEVIDNIENGTPLSQFTKDWMSNRKALR